MIHRARDTWDGPAALSENMKSGLRPFPLSACPKALSDARSRETLENRGKVIPLTASLTSPVLMNLLLTNMAVGVI